MDESEMKMESNAGWGKEQHIRVAAHKHVYTRAITYFHLTFHN